MTAVTRQPLRPVCLSKSNQEVATTDKRHLLSFQNQFSFTWTTTSLMLNLYISDQDVSQSLHLPQTWDIIQINKHETPRLSPSLSVSLFLSFSLIHAHTQTHKLTVVFLGNLDGMQLLPGQLGGTSRHFDSCSFCTKV